MGVAVVVAVRFRIDSKGDKIVAARRMRERKRAGDARYHGGRTHGGKQTRPSRERPLGYGREGGGAALCSGTKGVSCHSISHAKATKREEGEKGSFSSANNFSFAVFPAVPVARTVSYLHTALTFVCAVHSPLSFR